ncbi:tryptase-like [Osmerus eperlanus]|uniref:tryptase-like n=1 Tax=Osmerus eperlanus TaxID=29151 RepID=UPI002E14C481
MSLWALLLVSLLVHDAAGYFRNRAQSSIMGGEDAPVGHWPWMAQLTIYNGLDRKNYCGGTLISDEWVLTAAHCLDDEDLNLGGSSVRLGLLSLEGPSEYDLGISYTVSHPDYEEEYSLLLHDIALVKLSVKVTFTSSVAPVHLLGLQETFAQHSECWITGWGHVANNEPLDGKRTLQQAKVPIVKQSACKDAFPGVTSDMLCAGDLKHLACLGDSGGPLVCGTAQGRFVQVGIVSFGPSECGFPGVYTRVDKYTQFIKETIHF